MGNNNKNTFNTYCLTKILLKLILKCTKLHNLQNFPGEHASVTLLTHDFRRSMRHVTTRSAFLVNSSFSNVGNNNNQKHVFTYIVYLHYIAFFLKNTSTI